MSITRRALGAVAAGLTAIAITLSGCSTTTGGGGTGQPTDGSGGGADAQQTLRLAPGAFPQSLDAQYYPTELAVYNVAHQILDPLVTYENGEPTPVLAESWENPDDTTWVFNLREAKFSDGTDFTASDAKASVDRILELSGPIAPLFAAVETVEATDDRTLTITTSTPLGTLLNSLSMVFIGKADSVNDDAYWRAPIGTGPFVVSDYVADDRLTLTRNDSYWGDASILDSVEVVNMPEVSARITALKAGEIDAMTDVPPDQVSSVDGVEGLTFAAEDSYKYVVTWFNHNREPLADVRVRQALTYAVDLDSLIGSLYGDSATAMKAPITQAVFGSPDLGTQPFDPERARQLLVEAGYADGLTLEMIWPNDAAPNIRSFAQGLISGWADIGVTVTPFELERAQWSERFDGKDYDLSLFENVTTTGDASYTLARLYTCEADRMGYCDPKLDDLFQQGASSVDQDERKELYGDASEILWNDAVSLWLMELNNSYAVRDTVQNFSVRPTGMIELSVVSTTEG